MDTQHPEAVAVRRRYARRGQDDTYSLLHPDVCHTVQERQRHILRLFHRHVGIESIPKLSLLEVGAGNGDNLLEFLRLGFSPHNLAGIELLPERVTHARSVLPPALVVHEGDATCVPIPDRSFDIVYQSVVFSSILDHAFQQQLADSMWRWTRTGGAILWYDFIYNNPANRDVRAVPLRRVRQLFPRASIEAYRITLAPPLSRSICRRWPVTYGLLNRLPLLRTHLLCWISKKDQV